MCSDNRRCFFFQEKAMFLALLLWEIVKLVTQQLCRKSEPDFNSVILSSA